MVTSFRLALDACVLVPVTPCDALLTIADRRLYVPLWPAEILNEMERAVTRLATELKRNTRWASVAPEKPLPKPPLKRRDVANDPC